MRAAVLGVLAGVGLVLTISGVFRDRSPLFAQPPSGYGTGRGAAPAQLMTLSVPIAGGGQQIVLVDPEARTMGVYHVDPTSGEIALKSVRDFHWDLQMSEFNGGSPSPQEIRRMFADKQAPDGRRR